MSLEAVIAYTPDNGWHVAAVDTDQMLDHLADRDTPSTTRKEKRMLGDAAAELECTTAGCGDPLTGSGAKRNWILIRIVGSGDPPRRYCSGMCAGRGIAHVELGNHLTDRATVTPLQPPQTPRPGSPLRRHARNARLGSDTDWRDLLAALGKTAPDVRSWCREHAVLCPERGPIPRRAREAFLAAATGTERHTA